MEKSRILSCLASKRGLVIGWSIPGGRIDFLAQMPTSNTIMSREMLQYLIPERQAHHASQMDSRVNVVDLLIMDSWSDLVHQKFQNEKDLALFCNYNELNSTGKEELRAKGRLDIKCYALFESIIKLSAVAAHIIVIDFPAIHDSRVKIKLRSKELTKQLLRASSKFDWLDLVQIPYPMITLAGPRQGDHVYHFSDQTIQVYVDYFDRALKRFMVKENSKI